MTHQLYINMFLKDLQDLLYTQKNYSKALFKKNIKKVLLDIGSILGYTDINFTR